MILEIHLISAKDDAHIDEEYQFARDQVLSWFTC